MHEKSSDLDLTAAIVDRKGRTIGEEIVPPSERTLQAVARRGRRSIGGIWVPPQIFVRLTGATKAERCVIECLMRLEYLARVKREPLALTNVALEQFDVSRRSKLSILDRLEARGILTYSQSGRKSVRVLVHPKLWG
jgi:hypothetical protein